MKLFCKIPSKFVSFVLIFVFLATAFNFQSISAKNLSVDRNAINELEAINQKNASPDSYQKYMLMPAPTDTNLLNSSVTGLLSTVSHSGKL